MLTGRCTHKHRMIIYKIIRTMQIDDWKVEIKRKRNSTQRSVLQCRDTRISVRIIMYT